MKSVILYKILGLVCLGIISRLFPHPPNFTALNAIALYSGFYIGSLPIALCTVFSLMLFSDYVFFGLHSSIIFVYTSYGLISLMGQILRFDKSFIYTTILLGLSSLFFFIITNFGVWLSDSIYPKTAVGLSLCYLAGIPFFINNLLSTFLYGGILFGWRAFMKNSTNGNSRFLKTSNPNYFYDSLK
jgi:hypothetical protein